MSKQKYKVGNEFLPFHPQASHVSPDYRDGWNACWHAAIESRKPMTEDQMRQVISETSAIALFKHQDFVRAIERFHGIGK